MTLCPIALAVGCRKCPIFAVCPAKSLIGDYRKEDDAPVKGRRARCWAQGAIEAQGEEPPLGCERTKP